MREFDQTWTFSGTSGGGTAVEVTGDVVQSAWYVRVSTASTATVTIQSALTSTGPWYDELGTGALSTGASMVLRMAGPFAWVRPHNNSTADTLTVRAIGVS